MNVLRILGGTAALGGFILMLGGVGTLEMDETLQGWAMLPPILISIMGIVSCAAGLLLLNHIDD